MELRIQLEQLVADMSPLHRTEPNTWLVFVVPTWVWKNPWWVTTLEARESMVVLRLGRNVSSFSE